MSMMNLNEDLIDKWIDNIFNRIYKHQEDDALRAIRKSDINKSLKDKLAKWAEDAKQIRKDIDSGKYDF
jgi:hypothetical protein